ncbi:protein SOSEKI 2-like [Andrographis paniculata]|uniref:protein SOSEKI 2-like n=1 Tax=Andrographis paniculata TaxID=175694 RepID=UPI0021E7661D|nr:protein SOSEKI 2-like [Andrographis paniculata]XP_051140538.1 protein SOSEKI 2-like [Andrographis paniculata]
MERGCRDHHHHHHHHQLHHQATPERQQGKLKPMSSRAPSPAPATAFKKVEVVYYLSRNGHLEHPHYLEVTHLAHQHLRLKDVMDRLRNLRGKAMPSLYSWSCKRSYKNGYVWNDLGENDPIYPSQGQGGAATAEYVLKGSEIISDAPIQTDKLHNLRLGGYNNVQLQDSNFLPKKRMDEVVSSSSPYEDDDEEMMQGEQEEEEEEEVEVEYEMKTGSHGNGNENVSRSRCSRGVSTDVEIKKLQKTPNSELSLQSSSFSFSSPPTSTTSSETINNNNKKSDETSAALVSRNSVLLSLIACGGSASFRKTAAPPQVEAEAAGKPSPARKSNGVGGGNHNNKVKIGMKEEVMLMIGCMSENPRFGNLQGEEKEYFSGSIVESQINQNHQLATAGMLKKSSSHNEERSNGVGLGEEESWKEDNDSEEGGLKGKCIPGSSSSRSRKKKASKQSRN